MSEHIATPFRFLASPNFNERPEGIKIDCLVLHSTVIEWEETKALFLKLESKVSSHFVVNRDGEVVQMVDIEKRAWHAGESVLDGVPRVNDYSVGIEMVNRNDGIEPHPDEQYLAVASILRWLRERYEIPDSRIVSHTEIALPVGRKNDPRTFDFERLKRMARDNYK